MKNNVDEKYMRLALELAAKALGRTSPNPMVGAVLVKGGEVVSRGWHRKAGGPHAEVFALRDAGARAKGATLYLNLEPCSHQGRTPPCAPAVAASGVKKVVAAMKDPNPLVAGRGFALIRRAGIKVVTGVLESEARKLNESFIKYITTGLPFVTIKGAMTLDGKIATESGESKWITGEAARADAHKLRGWSDAVLVGRGTLEQDDPMLTCRMPRPPKQPYRIVLDSNLKTPLKSNIVKLATDGKTIIATLENAPARRAHALEAAGVVVMRIPPDKTGRPDIRALLAELGKMRITSLLVEGGGETSMSFLAAGLADKLVYYIAPKLLGGRQSPTVLEGEGFPSLNNAAQLRDVAVSHVGNDIKIEGYLS